MDRIRIDRRDQCLHALALRTRRAARGAVGDAPLHRAAAPTGGSGDEVLACIDALLAEVAPTTPTTRAGVRADLT